MARRQVPQALGLMETSPAGAVPLGHYDEGVNVRDFDERGQKARTAQRAGVLPLASSNPCPSSTPVTHAFTAKRALSRFEFAELSNTPDTTITPTEVEERWETALEARTVLDTAVTSDGLLVALLSDGMVVTVTDAGVVADAFPVPVPFSFMLVPSIAVDFDDGVFVAATYEREIDGGATRVWRYTRDEDDSDWEQQYEEIVSATFERFWYSDAELFAVTVRPDNLEEGDQSRYTLTRYSGVAFPSWSLVWQRVAPEPVVDVAFDDDGRAVYFAAPPRNGRAQLGNVTQDVQWTPRELRVAYPGTVDAQERLFHWSSALREQNVRGLSEGTVVNAWEEARFDTSDYDDVLDTTSRRLVDTSVTVGPTFQRDPDGFGPEMYFSREAELTAERLVTSRNVGSAIKFDPTDIASWQKSVFPIMGGYSTTNPGTTTGPTWASTLVFRMEQYQDFVTGNDVEYTTRKVVIEQKYGENDERFRVYYFSDVTNTTATIAFEIVNADGSLVLDRTTTLPVATNGEYVCMTIVCGGWGVSSASYVRVNGLQLSTAFTWETSTAMATTRSQVGWAGSEAFDPSDGTGYARFRGGMKEIVTWLGSSSGGDVHNVVIPLDDIERVEGYSMWAYGLQDELDNTHSYDGLVPPAGGSSPTNPGLEAALQTPDGILAKLDRATGVARWVRTEADCGNGVAAGGDVVYTIGTPLDSTVVTPVRFSRLTDDGDDFTVEWSVSDPTNGADTVWGTERVPMYVDPSDSVYVPWVSTGNVTASELRRYDTPSSTAEWTLALPEGPEQAQPGGLYVDNSGLLGAVGDEFVFVSTGGAFHRVDALGRRDTGETRTQETQVVATCESGVVARLTDSGWSQLAADFSPSTGFRPWSFEMFGRHYFGGPEDYRVWDPRVGQLREWTPAENSVIPKRIFAAVRWRGRAVVVSQDDPHVLFGSAYGEPTDFQTGGETTTATQAFAGTTAAAGAIPDPVTALMPATDDLLYVGTNRSIWRLTGDPQTGGQLDDIKATEGVASTDAWCRGDMGELFWMTTARRVIQLGQGGMVDISSTSIRGRLQQIDPEEYRIDLAYSDREQGLYVILIPRSGVYEPELTHLFWSKRSGRWHPVRFAGGIDRAVSSVGVLENADAGGWGAMFGFADGGLRFVHPEALDDDGVAIGSRMRIPVTGDGDPQKGMIQYAEVVLDPRQGPVRVAGVAGRTGDAGDDYGQEILITPGRGDVANLGVSGSHTWVEIIGTGEPWAMDFLAIDAHVWGAA